MDCTSLSPCHQDTCNRCNPSCTDVAPIDTTLRDTSTIIYHLNSEEVSKLNCLQLGSGTNLESILETIDRVLCERTIPDLESVDLSCFGETNRPATFTDLIVQLSASVCQLKTSLSTQAIATSLLALTNFINSLATKIVNSTAFQTAFLANQVLLESIASSTIFTNKLATDTNFITKLTANEAFITKLVDNSLFITKAGEKLVLSQTFLSSLTTAITNNPDLAQQFCCGDTDPCAGFTIEGISLTECGCTAPANVYISGPTTVGLSTDYIYSLSYSGTPGPVSWATTGGAVLISSTATSATLRFTASGGLTAALVGCNGQLYSASVSPVVATCAGVTGLTINTSQTIIPDVGKSTTFTSAFSTGQVLSYSWTAIGGTITGSATSASVTVTWSSNTNRRVNLSISDCTGTAVQATKVIQDFVETVTERVNVPVLICRTTGNCTNNGICGVRYRVTYDNLTNSGIYTTDLRNTSSNGVVLDINSFTKTGTQGEANLLYTESTANGSVTTTIVLKKDGVEVAANTITLNHTVTFSQVQLCVNELNATAGANNSGQLTISFDNALTTPPYTYQILNSNGDIQTTGIL